jgi:hypothetical protein
LTDTAALVAEIDARLREHASPERQRVRREVGSKLATGLKSGRAR